MYIGLGIQERMENVGLYILQRKGQQVIMLHFIGKVELAEIVEMAVLEEIMEIITEMGMGKITLLKKSMKILRK